MAKSLQRFKELWKTNPESMEARRKRGVERRILNCDKYFDKLFALFVHELGEEISPEQLNRICYNIINEKRNRGKWTKLKSVKRYLTKYRLIKYDFERDIYLNWRKIKHQEKERAEADRRKAEAEAQQAETLADYAEDEAQRIEAKATQAHRETQSQQGTQAEPSVLGRLKIARERIIKSLNWSISEAEKDTNPARSQGWQRAIEVSKERLRKTDLQISELEKCEAKCS